MSVGTQMPENFISAQEVFERRLRVSDQTPASWELRLCAKEWLTDQGFDMETTYHLVTDAKHYGWFLERLTPLERVDD